VPTHDELARLATTGGFLDNNIASELAMLHLNNRARLILAHHFGRSMRKQGRGGIIFVSSTVAFAGVQQRASVRAGGIIEFCR
jgi:short-subunit dehydrogenase